MKKALAAAAFAAALLYPVPGSPASFAQGPGALPASSPAANSRALASLFDTMWQDELRNSPEFASSLGDKRYNALLTDYSVRAVNESLARGRRYIEQLALIDTTGLSDQEKLSYDLMLRSLTDQQEGARFKEWEMPLNQFYGLHTDLPQLIGNLSFDTVKDYDDYIARLKKVPAAFAQVTTNLQSGITDGRVLPRYLAEKVVTQVVETAIQKPADSPFALPLKKFPASISADEQKRITAEVTAEITNDVLPTYARLARFLKTVYVPAGRTDPGIWAVKDGDAYYAYRIRQSTTLTKSAAEIHQIGEEEVKRDEAQMLVILKQLGFPDLKSFSAALKTNPKELPTSAAALQALYQHYEDQMQPRLPELFGRLPKNRLEVVAMPEYIAKTWAAAYYDPGTPDGKRPGRVNVNEYNFATRSLVPVEAVSYHEGIPGHHLQFSIAQELTGLPEFRKHLEYTAYTEGWALYSERLGKEIGFYQDPYSDYGRLEADIWRAIRLVVDTGVHSQHWTRQQMVDYFHEHSAIDEQNIQNEVDRYIAWPGQALGYKMGQLTILRLRARAKDALGDKFDLKAFHDLVLDSGPLPMDVLETRVDGWIAQQKR